MSAPRRTLIEDLLVEEQRYPRWLTVHPIIADTSALLADLIGNVRYAVPTPLTVAMGIGLLRIYCPQHVWAEMPRKIDEKAEDEHLDRALMERLWWTEYVPFIRFVDTGDLPASQHRFLVERDDRSDKPTFILADLLAPVPVLAMDKDLRRYGLACDDWKSVAKASRTLAVVGGGVYGGVAITVGVGFAVVDLARSIMRLLTNEWVQTALLGTAIAAVATRDRWRRVVELRAPSVRSGARTVWETVLDLIEDTVERVHAAYGAWDSALRGEPGGSVEHRIAGLLAARPAMTRREMADALLPDETEIVRRRAVRELLPVLQRCTAFCELRRGRWQIGRAAADFGLADELLGESSDALPVAG